MITRAAARAADALAVATTGDDPVVPPDIAAWLARLGLLYGVPFQALVPDWRLLPTESLRFFMVDATWVAAALQGASSVGTTTTFDDLLGQRLAPALAAAARAGRAAVRDQLRGVTARDDVDPDAPMTGFLLRSSVVSGYPGLEVAARDAAGAAVPLLRMDRLSADTLLVLLAGVPALVTLQEPAEGLHFGFHQDGSGRDIVYLRGLGAGGYAAGVELVPQVPVIAPMRASGAAGVVDVAAFAANLAAALPATALPPGGLFPSGFAVEVVSAAGLQPFAPPERA